MPNNEAYEKLNDYTLSVINDFDRQSGADPELRRIFNFKARHITSIFSQYSGSGVANAMLVQNFSDLDSLEEVELMHQKLKAQGGNPPDLAEKPAKPAARGPALNA